ncbi:MAG: hypothetical protein ACF8CQ_15260 [Rhodopirellula sp. JB044]|uniref:hypothetical protein n=1 Tax=Rhodopirellula sp. JB044 TaxID=3342844 RepID=UPI00370C3A59
MLWDSSSTRTTDFDSTEENASQSYEPVIVPAVNLSSGPTTDSHAATPSLPGEARQSADASEVETDSENAVLANTESTADLETGDLETSVSESGSPSAVVRPDCDVASLRMLRHVLALAVCFCGATGWALAFGVATLTLTSRVSEYAGFAFDEWVPTLIATATFGAIISLLVVPTGLRSLGIRVQKRMPEKLSRWTDMASVADHLKTMRVTLSVAIALPAIVILARQLSGTLTQPIPRPIDWLPTLGIAIACFGVAVLIRGAASTLYRRTHAQSLKRSLRAHHRGVALRSFIAQWDNPAREIYRTCRLSNRLALVHRTLTVSVLGLLSAAGCVAALVSTDFYAGEILCGLSIAAIAWQWPTSHRLVTWSGLIIDPFCGERDEYEEFG